MTDQPTPETELAELRRKLAAPGPTGEQIAAWNEADRAMAERIRKARPGVPLHHAYATLQTLRTVQRLESAGEQPDVSEQLRTEADAWRRKAIRRALGTSKLRGAIDGCRDLIGEDITRSDAWGDGYREAISDLREILQAFGQLEDAHDGPSIAECAAADRAHWDDKYAGGH